MYQGSGKDFDLFGWSIAAGDFDGDSFSDLAIGVPYKDRVIRFRTTQDVGNVIVVYGNSAGLTGGRSQTFYQGLACGTGGIPGLAQTNDLFGFALTTGDFDDDTFDDLAIGSPYDLNSAGTVTIIPGSAMGGLQCAKATQWHQDSLNVAGEAQSNDGFGKALTSGYFDGNRYADLAVGVPGETIDGKTQAGAVNVFYGTVDGIGAAKNKVWHQGKGLKGTVEADDRFGEAITAGDFDADGIEDLAVGVPGEAIGSISDAGAVNIIYGASNDGLSDYRNELWDQSPWTTTIGGATQNNEFGFSLSAGDFNLDGSADLAVGIPYQKINGKASAGAVVILHGAGAEGMNSVPNSFWYQATSPGLNGVAHEGDHFGSALKVGDFNRDGYADLAIGVPGEHAIEDGAGAINVLYGSAGRLVISGTNFFHQWLLGQYPMPGEGFGKL